MDRTGRGWSLPEAVVLIAALSVLASLVLPVLAAERDEARASQCMDNHRRIYQAMDAFAWQYDGHLPGSGSIHLTGDRRSSYSWHQMLGGVTGLEINRIGTPAPGALHCPAHTEPEPTARWVGMNTTAAGRPAWGRELAASRTASRPPPASSRALDSWNFGVRVDMFRDPTFTFLTREVQANVDYVSHRFPGGADIANAFDERTGLAYNGRYAFRHQHTGMFLLADGRVEQLGPADNVNSQQRYRLEGRDYTQ